jgi:hypothetical protein
MKNTFKVRGMSIFQLLNAKNIFNTLIYTTLLISSPSREDIAIVANPIVERHYTQSVDTLHYTTTLQLVNHWYLPNFQQYR